MQASLSNGSQEATFILKCTRNCNLRCTYCTDHRKSSSRMDVAFLAKFYHSLTEDKELDHISLIWHGGEPLTMGISFLRKNFFLQRRILSEKGTVRNTIQTNGVLLNDEWAAHLKEYNFTVGVSIDGPPKVHDSTRRTAGGRDSFSNSIKGVKTLQHHKVQVGVLTVLSEELLLLGPKRIMQFFHEEGINSYALLHLRKDWSENSEAFAYARSFGEFMKKLAELWFEEDSTKVNIRELNSKLDRFFGLPTRICTDCGACVGKYFGIEPDGGIWHCDKFLGDDRFYFGSIGDDSFSKIRDSKQLATLKEYEAEVRLQCANCQWFEMCRGGCLYDCAIFHAKGGRPGTDDCPSVVLFERMSRLIAESPIFDFEASSEKSLS